MLSMVERTTSIQVTKKLQEYLKKQGTKGETYDNLIWRLIQKNKTKGE